MFQQTAPKSRLDSAIVIAELIYHNAVRTVRKTHNNAVMSILMNMVQAATFVLAFFLMFSVIPGMRSSAIRGDYLLYIMSGVFLFMTHVKTMGSVVGSEGPASPMMQHAPMTTAIAIAAAMLSSLYVQVISMFTILFLYYTAWQPFEIYDAAGCMAMLLLAWFTGAAVGMVFLALKPWFPTAVGIATTIYQRANMIASGKMFVANTLPGFMLVMFDWNPLFHTIDQARGFAFINYTPHNSTIAYPLILGVVLFTIGLMGEFYTRKHASASWSARR
ncbi:ABC transporter permease [Pseudoprimorskyibacter insulae]|uniref:ABC-2 type transporter domain-containing protein n=1 Tax=Pseudoprimorskyibacter insulae TaxID=1695997 RepID=A0A2R8AU24_9RHOB|nr:ABC transporter permease [Pseudoprimorskyibacter insulae]SPF79374.1 hypothetical protein PRI8871_01169 [Pseudoprimorskyibacter insulae]